MILDGNSKVGSAKVYATQKEMDQEKQIEKLKSDLKREQVITDTVALFYDHDADDLGYPDGEAPTEYSKIIKLARLTQQQRREG